ncbi:MAG: hypothetical protein ACK5C8_08030 [Roseiflexaceae bacterium]|jgi:hypothetical protein
MNQNLERNDWGVAYYARLVRDEHEYWVEWVMDVIDNSPEPIATVKHATTPHQAMQYARDAIADFYAQIARGEYYTVDFDVTSEEAADYPKLTPGDIDTGIYLRFPLGAMGESRYKLVGHIIGHYVDIASIVRDTSRAGVAAMSQQLDEIPPLDSNLWMLIA